MIYHRVFVVLSFCAAAIASDPVKAANESNLTIVALGAWAGDNVNGAQTTYVRVDRVVGPPACRDTLVKIDMKEAGESGRFIKRLLLTAFFSQRKISLETSSDCLYANPTFRTLQVSR